MFQNIILIIEKRLAKIGRVPIHEEYLNLNGLDL